MWNLEKFPDPVVRELWKKGQNCKLPMAAETLHAQIAEGLEAYINYMRNPQNAPRGTFNMRPACSSPPT